MTQKKKSLWQKIKRKDNLQRIKMLRRKKNQDLSGVTQVWDVWSIIKWSALATVVLGILGTFGGRC
jgi:hypothetical protein